MGRAGTCLWCGALLALLLPSSCGSSHSAAPATPTPVLKNGHMSRKIARAVKAGPGFLDYCPRHPGTAPAELQVDMPGNPLIHARCRTSIQVQSAGERVTFQIRWDARKVLHRTGESTLTYLVPRSHGQILLIKQTGTLPP